MAMFDDKLSEVFRNKKSLKAEKRDALKAMLDFKLRTIDLLEIFIKKQPSNPLVLDIMMPALDALRKVSGVLLLGNPAVPLPRVVRMAAVSAIDGPFV